MTEQRALCQVRCACAVRYTVIKRFPNVLLARLALAETRGTPARAEFPAFPAFNASTPESKKPAPFLGRAASEGLDGVPAHRIRMAA